MPEYTTSFDSLLRDRVTIQKHDLSPGFRIGLVYTNLNTNVPARIEPSSSTRSSTFMGKFPNATHRMFLRASYTVQAGYRIVKGSVTYEVEGVNNYFDHHLEVVLQEKKVVAP